MLRVIQHHSRAVQFQKRTLSTVCRQDLNKRVGILEYKYVNDKLDMTMLHRELESIKEDSNKNRVNTELLRRENESCKEELYALKQDVLYLERLNSGSLSWLPRV